MVKNITGSFQLILVKLIIIVGGHFLLNSMDLIILAGLTLTDSNWGLSDSSLLFGVCFTVNLCRMGSVLCHS